MEKKDIIPRWIMHDSNHFTYHKGGYIADLDVNGAFYPVWRIFKDGVEIDNALYHQPVTSKSNKELAGKAMCEKMVARLIDKETLTPQPK